MSEFVTNSEVSTPRWPELIARAKAGEEDAWRELLAQTRPWAIERMAGRVSDLHAREDVAQEIMITLCRKLDTLREPDRFAGWFAALVDSAALAWGRKRHAQLRLEDAWKNHTSHETEGEAELTDAIVTRRMMLTVAFRALSLEHQAVVRSRYLQGRGYADTAVQLGIEETLVRGRLQKARLQLKRNMNQQKNMQLNPEFHDLGSADLSTLRALSLLTRRGEAPDTGRAVLSGICLLPGGRVIATDGRRVVFRRLSALSGLSRQLVLGPAVSPDFLPVIAGGRLTPELSVCSLEDAAGRRHELPLITSPEYPSVEHLLDAKWVAGWRIKVAKLRDTMNAFAPFLAAGHPTTSSNQEYTPLLRMRVCTGMASIIFETDKLLGYNDSQQNIMATHAGQSGWRHEVYAQAEATEGDPGEPERMLVINAELFSGLLDALEPTASDEIWLRVQEPTDTALGLQIANDSDRSGQIMPVRLS